MRSFARPALIAAGLLALAGFIANAGPTTTTGTRLYTASGSSSSSSSSGGFTPAGGFGATVVSTVADGNILVVTRSSGSFGTHAANLNPSNFTWKGNNYLCIAFKDFDDGVIESQGFEKQAGGSPWSAASDELFLGTSSLPTNSTNYMARHYQTTSGEDGGLSISAPVTSAHAYVSFKFYQISGGQAGKFFRMYATGNQQNVYAATGNNPSNPDYSLRMFSECVAGSCSGATTDFGNNIGTNTWRHIEFEFTNATNVSRSWVDGSLSSDVSNYLDTAGSVMVSGHTIDFPNMIDGASRGGGTAGEFRYTDIFIDTSTGRFFIDDSPNREPQIPIKGSGGWTTTSVALAINVGEMASLSGKSLKFWNGTTTETVGTFDMLVLLGFGWRRRRAANEDFAQMLRAA